MKLKSKRAHTTYAPTRVKRAPTSDALKAKLSALIDGPLLEQLGYLYARWQDERDYEDFRDYAAKARELLHDAAPEFVFLGLSKRPFMMIFEVIDVFVPKQYGIVVTRTSIAWERVA